MSSNEKPLTPIEKYKSIKFNNNPKLTILSMGLGQDSTTILLKLIHDKDFRKKYAPNDLLVLFANTGNEHPYTYSYRDRVIIPLCKELNIEFVSIESHMGYHGKNWESLTTRWETGTPSIGSLAFAKFMNCSHNLKLNPQYRYVEELIAKRYDGIINKARKQNYKQFVDLFGSKVRFLIGIAREEENRIFDVENETLNWKKECVEVQYPLIDIGYNRKDCQDYIAAIKTEIPYPSNCMYCPYASTHLELLFMYYTYPDKFNEWVRYEQAKLDAYKHEEKNLGVSGRVHKSGDRKGEAINLLDVLDEALKKYPNITLQELNNYKFSHGSNVNSKY